MATVIRGDDNFDTSIGSNMVQTHVTSASAQALAANTRVDILALTASITPKYTTSKIMVEVRWQGESNGNNENIVFGIRRGGVDVGNGDASGSKASGIAGISQGYPNVDNNSTMDSATYSFLDSPSTTSEITYTATIMNRQISTIYHNQTVSTSDSSVYERLTSSITLTEVQG